MKRAIGAILVLVFAVIFAVSCSKSNPTAPEPTSTKTNTLTPTLTYTPTFTPTPTFTQTGLYIERADIIQAQTSHGVGNANATVILRYGNSSGAYVQGATITIGAATLTESPAGHYTTALANIADGTTCNLSISSLAGNVNASVTAPSDAYVLTPSTSGGNQSASAQMPICTDFCATSCPMPQSVMLLLWRDSDSTVYVNQTVTPPPGGNNYDSACWNVNANVLPTMGQIYVRFYSINQSAISGSNGGSAMFKFLNSENTRYVNMIP